MFNIKRFLVKYFNVMYLFIPFIILIVLTGIISTFTIYNHNSQISGIIEAVEIGKNIQIELQKQFYNLKTIVEEDEFSDIYKHKVHDYSYNVQIIQNELFNLGLLCKENKEIYDQIQEFAKYYKELNDGILSYIVNINAQKQFNDTNIISIQMGEEQKAIQLIEDIVKKIDESSDEKLKYLNKYSFVMSTVSFIVLTIFSLIVSLYLSQLLNKFKDKLEQRVIKRTEQLQKAKDQIMLSEQRYKFLVESTNDIVFTMDMDGIVLTINNAVKKELKIKPSEAIGKNFYDFLYFGNDTNNLKNIFLRKNIKNFLNEKKQIKFYSLIKTPRLIEPIEMFVSLEAVEINGNKEIVGKASNMLENDLIGSFIYEHVKYEINNSLLLADEIAHRVVVNLKKFLPNNIISQLRLATSELLINAIEHGNLGITYKDKLTRMEMDDYFDYVSQKINEINNKNKKVKVEFLINDEKFMLKITDQGKGFDHKNYTNKSDASSNESFLQHGRGISLAKSIFDEIKYNEKGNQVLCIKYFNGIHTEENNCLKENSVGESFAR